MRLVITGGAGFIGSHLSQQLINKGHEVICLDNLCSGNISNISRLRKEPRFSFRNKDITKDISVGGGVDWVVHLASLASPKFYQMFPVKTMRAGSIGTHKTLELARGKDASYLFASTSEVYGDPDTHPQTESYNGNVDPVGPRACYDESKRYGEALTTTYRDRYGVDIRIPRIFNTYGPKMNKNDGRVIPNFATQALTGKDLTIYGDGSQTRSFCYINDMVNGLLALMDSNLTKPVNIGNTEEISINTLANKVLDMVDTDSGTVYEPLPQDDPQVRKPDISRIRNRVGWAPETSLETGLRETIQWFYLTIN